MPHAGVDGCCGAAGVVVGYWLLDCGDMTACRVLDGVVGIVDTEDGGGLWELLPIVVLVAVTLLLLLLLLVVGCASGVVYRKTVCVTLSAAQIKSE